MLFLLAALFCAPTIHAAAAPAPAASGCSASLRSDVENLAAQGRQLGADIRAHNARQGSVDTTNAGAVGAYNAEAAALEARKATLGPQFAAAAARIETCGSQIAAPALPDASGNTPPTSGTRVPPQATPLPSQPRLAPAQPRIEPKSPQAPPVPSTSPAPRSDAPTAVENSRAPIEVKINDPDYLRRNFEKAGPGGELRRKAAPGALDADGDVIPKISRDPSAPGRNRVTPDTADVPATFTSKVHLDPAPSDGPVQQAVDARARATASGDNRRITDAGEALGEAAGRASIDREFPPAAFDVKELTDRNTRGVRGEPDQVFRVVPRDGGPTRIIVNEAKSPYGSLGARRGRDGRLYQQGTRGYLESLLQAMGVGPLPLRAVAREMRDALDDGQLTYRLVQARVPTDGRWNGYIVRDFDIR